jgi:Na+-driven multidrug efflux pump
VYEVLWLTFKVLTGYGILISLIYLIYPKFLLGLFTSGEEMLLASQFAVRFIMATFCIVGFQITIGTYYQSVGLYKKAFILSLLRQLFVYIPFVVLFAWLGKLMGIWWSFPVTDVVAAIITIFIFRKDWLRLRKLADGAKAEVSLGEVVG